MSSANSKPLPFQSSSDNHFLRQNNSNNNSYKEDDSLANKLYFNSNISEIGSSNLTSNIKRLEEEKLAEDIGGSISNLNDNSYYNQLTDENCLKYDNFSFLTNTGRIETATDVDGTFLGVNRSSLINELSTSNPYLMSSPLNERGLISNDYVSAHFGKFSHSNMFSVDNMSSFCDNAKTSSIYNSGNLETNGVDYETYCKDALKYAKIPRNSFENHAAQHALENHLYVGHSHPLMDKSLMYDTNPTYSFRSNCSEYSNVPNSLLSPNNFAVEYGGANYAAKVENRTFDGSLCGRTGFDFKNCDTSYKNISDVGSSTYSNQLKQLTNCSSKMPGYSSSTDPSNYHTDEKKIIKSKKEIRSMIYGLDPNMSKLQQLSDNGYPSIKSSSCYANLENNSLSYETACLQQSGHPSPPDANLHRSFCSPLSGSDQGSQISSDDRGNHPTETFYKNFSTNRGQIPQEDASINGDQSAVVVEKSNRATPSSSDASINFQQLKAEQSLQESNGKRRNDYSETSKN